jgi:hypothetical protein
MPSLRVLLGGLEIVGDIAEAWDGMDINCHKQAQLRQVPATQ